MPLPFIPVDVALIRSFIILQAKSGIIAKGFVSALKQLTPVRTGFLRGKAKYWDLTKIPKFGFSFRLGWQREDFELGGTEFYAPLVVRGSGIYAGRGRIKPLYAKRLAWQYRGQWVSAPSIAGQKPQDLLNKAVKVGRAFVGAHIRVSVSEGFKSVFK